MPDINPHFRKLDKPHRSVSEYVDLITQGDRFALSEAMTLVESQVEHKRMLAKEILSHYKPDKHSFRIGITGSPGAGKSSFIEQMGKKIIAKGHKVAVLAIDPSSVKSSGSILGDKTRMSELSVHNSAFIRPSSTSNALGGVSRRTKELIALCEMAGYEYIFVESVGVGQSEIEISNLVDVTLLLLLPGGGDEIQGIKRGIIEVADIFIINKADGKQLENARISKKEYVNAIQFMKHDLQGWRQPVILSSSEVDVNNNMECVLEKIHAYISMLLSTDEFERQRIRQDERWIRGQLEHAILTEIFGKNNISQTLSDTKGDESYVNVFVKLQQIIEKIKRSF